MSKPTPTQATRTQAEQFALPGTHTDLSPAVIPAPTAQDAEMGEQLTAQFKRAKATAEDAVLQAVIFGTMMLKLRQHIVLSARRQNSATRGPSAKGNGLGAWLETNAPEVSRGTAYDWMALAEGLQRHFQLKPDVDVAALLTSGGDLAPKLAKKAAKIREFLEGRSQRQLQLVFGNKTTGGKRERDPAKHYENATEDSKELAAMDFWEPIIRDLEEGCTSRSWAHLPDDVRTRLKGVLIDLNREISA